MSAPGAAALEALDLVATAPALSAAPVPVAESVAASAWSIAAAAASSIDRA